MFTKHKKLALIVSLIGTIILLSSFAVSTYAQGRHHNNSMRGMSSDYGRQWNDNVPQKYQLSADQMTSIREIRSQYDDQIFPLQRDIRALRIEAKGYSSRSDAEIEKIKSYREDINNLSDKMEELRLEARAEINKVLSKEQLAYFGNNFGWGEMDSCIMDHTGNGMGGCPMKSHSNQ